MTTKQRILGALGGGILGAIAWLLFQYLESGIDIGSASDLVVLALPGVVIGAVLGICYPKPLAWIAEIICDAWP